MFTLHIAGFTVSSLILSLCFEVWMCETPTSSFLLLHASASPFLSSLHMYTKQISFLLSWRKRRKTKTKNNLFSIFRRCKMAVSSACWPNWVPSTRGQSKSDLHEDALLCLLFCHDYTCVLCESGFRRTRRGQKPATATCWSFSGIICFIRWRKRGRPGSTSVTLSPASTKSVVNYCVPCSCFQYQQLNSCEIAQHAEWPIFISSVPSYCACVSEPKREQK